MMEKEILENILLENLKEQRRARRWKIFFRLSWLIIIIICLISIMGKTDKESLYSKEKKHVAVVELSGIINAENDTYKNLDKGLIKALKDKNTLAVIIRANSPGGSPIYSNMLYNEITRLRKSYPNKPIEVAIEEMCASGCYYIASAANDIYADPSSIVGSIGVIYLGFGATGAISKLGIDSRLLISGKNKAMGYPFIPVNKEQVNMQQKMLDEVHEQFITAVKQGRGKRLKPDPDLFTGRYWIGVEAIKLGLIDGYGTVDSIALNKFNTDNVVDFTYHEDGIDKIMKRFSDDIVDSAKQVIATPEFGFMR
jgi:protease IV